MELKDVIHYYFKCWGIVYDSVTEKYENGKWALSANLLHCVMIDECKFKPILRRLSSMTEEERMELWKLIFNRSFHVNGRTIFFDKPTNSSEPRWVLSSGVERLGIELNGTVWADSDLHIFKHNQHEVTHYLLSKHFDLFGLIDSNQAIDRLNQ